MTEPNDGRTRPRIEAQSRIVGVVVHGRGAVVTRRIELDALPEGAFDLVVKGITPLADPGSARVAMPEKGRPLVAVRSEFFVPSQAGPAGETVERLEQINRRIDAATMRQQALKERRKRLIEFFLVPAGRKALMEDGPLTRIEQSLTLSHMIEDKISDLDAKLVAVAMELDDLGRERQQAEIDDAQASSDDRMGESHPRRHFVLQVAGGGGDVAGAELTYVVPWAARWWPVYSLRLTDGGKAAELAIEALVAQRTGEDWNGVPVGLSTSEIIFDSTLPRLPSLRLGKVQPPKRTGFRAPPDGLDRMFQSYDSFKQPDQEFPAESTAVRAKPVPSAPVPLQNAPFAQSSFGAPPPSGAAAPPPTFERKPDMSFEAEEVMSYDSIAMSAAPMRAKRRGSLIGSMADAVAGGMAAAADAMMDLRETGGAYGGEGYGGGGGFGPTSVDAKDVWLEHEALVLAEAGSFNRGRLQRRPLPRPEAASLNSAEEQAHRLGLVDPAVSRGLFDYRYDALGGARVPSDGRLHRVEVVSKNAPSQLMWRTTPSVEEGVYREAEFVNPHESPLLSGPVDVYSEGQLVTTTGVDNVDVGGKLRVGLGLDDRIRVARNVRMREESAGLLGGKRELVHEIEIELRSGLGFDAKIDVLERVPVTADEHVKVDLTKLKPKADEYDQAELGAPVEGGYRWSIALRAGATETLEMTYVIELRSKDELVGGNRRD